MYSLERFELMLMKAGEVYLFEDNNSYILNENQGIFIKHIYGAKQPLEGFL